MSGMLLVVIPSLVPADLGLDWGQWANEVGGVTLRTLAEVLQVISPESRCLLIDFRPGHPTLPLDLTQQLNGNTATILRRMFDILTTVTVSPPKPTDGLLPKPGHADAFHASLTSLEVLVQELRRLSQGFSGAMSSATTGHPETIAGTLVRALVSPALSMQGFLACAAALRSSSDLTGHLTPESTAEQIVSEALARTQSSDSRVTTVLDTVRSAAACHERPRMARIARALRVDATHMSRLLKRETGFEFTEWRTAFLLRPSLRPLLESDEDIKQIACRLLDYKHQSQFTHEFRRFFGSSA